MSQPQPHPLTSVFQQTITAIAVCVATTGVLLGGAALIFALRAAKDDRDARLVEIGVRVLMVDPKKEGQVLAAREWAIDLIDANAGVKFSPAARAALLEGALQVGGTDFGVYASPGNTGPQSHPGNVAPQVPDTPPSEK